MRRNFDHPGRLHFDHIPHVFLSRQHELMIDHAFWLILMQHRTGMDPYVHVVFGGFVHLITMVLCAVYEETTDDAFTDVCVVVVLVDA